MENKSNDTYSLAHTSWKCQYHIVFAPKYRRKAIYGKLKRDIGAILRELCERKHVSIIEANAMPDHIHMLLSIPPKYTAVSRIIAAIVRLLIDKLIAFAARYQIVFELLHLIFADIINFCGRKNISEHIAVVA